MEITSSRDKNNDIKYTITKSISGNEQVKEALRRHIMSYFDLAHAIYLSALYKLNLKDPQKIIKEMVKWTKGIPEQDIMNLCHDVAYNVLLPSVYEEARVEIKAHKEKNARIVILSSALSPICKVMSESLDIDDIICSELEVRNGFLTGLPVGNMCFGPEKEVRLRKYCEVNNIKPSDSWYYGDSIADIQALNAVGNPVCINPDRRLRKQAIQKGWSILLWKSI
jgi:HAD superfamily hydrolase (TIGR01490 family)